MPRMRLQRVRVDLPETGSQVGRVDSGARAGSTPRFACVGALASGVRPAYSAASGVSTRAVFGLGFEGGWP